MDPLLYCTHMRETATILALVEDFFQPSAFTSLTSKRSKWKQNRFLLSVTDIDTDIDIDTDTSDATGDTFR